MKNLLITAGLCVALASSLAATAISPASASPTLPLPPPHAALPDLINLPLRPVVSQETQRTRRRTQGDAAKEAMP